MFQEELHSLYSFKESDNESTITTKDLENENNQIHQIPKHLIEMIHSVNSLLGRLDKECMKTKELLFKEKDRTSALSEKIDWHAYRRIHELRKAVQKGIFKLH